MKLSSGASRLLSRLRWWLRRFGAIFPSQDKLASGLGVCKRTVQRWLDELREAGFVQVERRYRRSNIYTLSDARQMCFDFETQETKQVVVEPKSYEPLCHHTVVPVVTPSTRKASRREMFSPSVVFQVVYRRFAHKKTAERKTETRWDRLREWAKQEQARLEGLRVAV